MAQVYVPESLPPDSQASQQRHDYTFEPTQLSQPQFSQTQQFANSQVEPRRKYWAILIPINPAHRILKVPWNRPTLQLGRGPPSATRNDVVLSEKRVSNQHCRLTLGIQGENGSGTSQDSITAWKEGEVEPEVWLEDLKSSNGTFVNGEKVRTRRLLVHGDEVSLGHAGTLENHDVRYIFRSVGCKGARIGRNGSKALENVGEVYENYQFLETLGTGSFATVKKAVHLGTGDLRAVKQIVKHRFANNPKTLQLFHREIDICLSLQHENICRLIEYYEDPQHICLVLEYVEGGDLLDHIMNWPSSKGGLPEDYAASLTLQLCRAMAYTHSLGVTHRDLKPENILLTRPEANAPPMVKIADFGLAKMVHEGTMLVSMVGTPQYLAPEVVMQRKDCPGYENVVDSWSVGIIVYSMMTKALPFDDDEDLPVEKRIKARYTQPNDTKYLVELGISDLAIDFISRLLAKEPSQRMTMAEALEHEWLAGPSSQQSESQKQGLGGDSVWEIESFDEDFAPASDEGHHDWSRPMTASGTNLESGMGGLGSSASEDFSQPMHNLHLYTPGIKRDQSNGNGFIGNDRQPSGLQNGYRASASPPSPPLTEERMDLDDNRQPVNVPAPTEPATPPVFDKENEHEGLPTPAEPNANVDAMSITNTQKRKILHSNPFFSSGSLSPPPEDEAGEVNIALTNGHGHGHANVDGQGANDEKENVAIVGHQQQQLQRENIRTSPRKPKSTTQSPRKATPKSTPAQAGTRRATRSMKPVGATAGGEGTKSPTAIAVSTPVTKSTAASPVPLTDVAVAASPAKRTSARPRKSIKLV